jgi:hypothetical protein
MMTPRPIKKGDYVKRKKDGLIVHVVSPVYWRSEPVQLRDHVDPPAWSFSGTCTLDSGSMAAGGYDIQDVEHIDGSPIETPDRSVPR